MPIEFFVKQDAAGNYLYDAAGRPIIGYRDVVSAWPTGHEPPLPIDQLREEIGGAGGKQRAKFTPEGGIQN